MSKQSPAMTNDEGGVCCHNHTSYIKDTGLYIRGLHHAEQHPSFFTCHSSLSEPPTHNYGKVHLRSTYRRQVKENKPYFLRISKVSPIFVDNFFDHFVGLFYYTPACLQLRRTPYSAPLPSG